MWETCDIEVWDTTRDLVFPVTKDGDIVKSARDATETRRTNFIVSPEIFRCPTDPHSSDAQPTPIVATSLSRTIDTLPKPDKFKRRKKESQEAKDK